MRVHVGTYDLWDRAAGRSVEAELYEGLIERNLEDVEVRWRRDFALAQGRHPLMADSARVQLQDAHWDWRRKYEIASRGLNYRSFVLECDGMTQGLMVLELVAHLGRLPEHAGRHLVYVEFLASAPWNRPQLVVDARFRGVGQIMISAAISASFEEEFDGRLALHSLPQADAFYRRCGMTDLGLDSDYPGSLRYFEFTSSQSKHFLNL